MRVSQLYCDTQTSSSPAECSGQQLLERVSVEHIHSLARSQANKQLIMHLSLQTDREAPHTDTYHTCGWGIGLRGEQPVGTTHGSKAIDQSDLSLSLFTHSITERSLLKLFSLFSQEQKNTAAPLQPESKHTLQLKSTHVSSNISTESSLKCKCV